MAQKTYISLDKLKVYDEKIKALMDSKDAANLKAAKDYADGLAVNYESAGAANTALEAAKAYADGKDTAIAAAKKAGDDAAAAAAVADGKAAQAQSDVDALETYVGTFTHETAKSVVEYVDAKTSGIATSDNLEALTERVAQAETDIDNIEKDYLTSANQTALEGQIEAVQGAVDAEKERAMGVEGGLETRLKAVEDDHLTSEDLATLEASIKSNTDAIELLTNGVDSETVDGVNDLIQYVKDHGTEVTGMQEDISKNAEDIAGVAERIGTAEGNITSLQGAVATKVEQEAYDTKISALEDADAGQVERIVALEAKFGEGDGSVEDQIADAKAEAVSEATAAAATDATTKANAAESNAKAHANDLNAAMDARVVALEAIDHDHANKAELDLIATGDKAKWDAAAAIAHEHGNKSVLDGITAQNISTWNTVTSKAAQDDLTAVGDRVTALETWHNDFTEVSEAEINGLFA